MTIGVWGCVLLGAYTLAQLTWFLISPDNSINMSDDMIADTAVVARKQVATDIVDVNRLKNWKLFGIVNAKPVETKKPKPVQTAPETTLRLELKGVFLADADADSTAIIAEKGKEGSLFRVGERVPGNATLETVYEEHVLLKRSGRLETLRFPEASGKELFSAGEQEASPRRGDADARSRNSNNSSRARREIARNRNSANQRESSSSVGKLFDRGRNPNPNQLLKSFSNDFNSDPNALMSDLGVEMIPPSEGGGYRITSASPQALVKMVGLRNGDIVRSVNGQVLGETLADQALYQQLMGESEATVEVQRGSRTFTVTVPIPNL